MNKHTPGPWEILSGRFVPTQMAAGSKMYVIQTADEHNDNIGFACSWLDDPETLKEARANANLFAAAPDLLEACEEFRNVLRSKIRDGKYREEYAEAFYRAERKMERAIARAKGESQ